MSNSQSINIKRIFIAREASKPLKTVIFWELGNARSLGRENDGPMFWDYVEMCFCLHNLTGFEQIGCEKLIRRKMNHCHRGQHHLLRSTDSSIPDRCQKFVEMDSKWTLDGHQYLFWNKFSEKLKKRFFQLPTKLFTQKRDSLMGKTRKWKISLKKVWIINTRDKTITQISFIFISLSLKAEFCVTREKTKANAWISR